jgi:methionyl aminopeptidase
MFILKRNELCWCKSGEKYKKCHLRSDEKLSDLARQGYPIPDQSIIKSKEDLDGIRKSSQLTSKILDDLNTIIKPGITTNDIDKWVYDITRSHNAIPAPLNYKGFPKSVCTSLNEVICHGIPSERVLLEGDNLNVDVTCILDGYFGDSCRMYEVGTVSDDVKALNKVTKECLYKGLDAIKPFQSINAIGKAIETHATANGYSVVDMFGGHGTGNEFHEDPFIHHNIMKSKLMIMMPGMVFTVEPMINVGKSHAKILKDGWTAITKDKSLSAQWEHTIVVTETGHEILTASERF